VADISHVTTIAHSLAAIGHRCVLLADIARVGLAAL